MHPDFNPTGKCRLTKISVQEAFVVARTSRQLNVQLLLDATTERFTGAETLQFVNMHLN